MTPIGPIDGVVQLVRQLSPLGDFNGGKQRLIAILDRAAVLGGIVPTTAPTSPGSDSSITLAGTPLVHSATPVLAEQHQQKRKRVAEHDVEQGFSEYAETPAKASRLSTPLSNGIDRPRLAYGGNFAMQNRHIYDYPHGRHHVITCPPYYSTTGNEVANSRLPSTAPPSATGNVFNRMGVSSSPPSSRMRPPPLPVPNICKSNGSGMPIDVHASSPTPQHNTAYNLATATHPHVPQTQFYEVQNDSDGLVQKTQHNHAGDVQNTIPNAIPQVTSSATELEDQPAPTRALVTLSLQSEKLQSLIQTMESRHQHDHNETQQTATAEEAMSTVADGQENVANATDSGEDEDEDEDEDEYNGEDWTEAYVSNWDEHMGLQDRESSQADNLDEIEAQIRGWEAEVALKKREMKNWEEAKEEWHEDDNGYEANMEMYEEKMGEYEEEMENLELAGERLERLKRKLLRKQKESGSHA